MDDGGTKLEVSSISEYSRQDDGSSKRVQIRYINQLGADFFSPQGRGASRGSRGATKRGGSAAGPSSQEKPKREAILDLSKYVGVKIKVTFAGGRQGKFLLVSFLLA